MIEALKLADELDTLSQYVPSEAPAMIRKLVAALYSETTQEVRVSKDLTDQELLTLAKDYVHYTEYKQAVKFAREVLRKVHENETI